MPPTLLISNYPGRLQQPPRTLLTRITHPSLEIDIASPLRLPRLEFPLIALYLHGIHSLCRGLFRVRKNPPHLEGVDIQFIFDGLVKRRRRTGWQEDAVVTDGQSNEICRFEIHVYRETACAVWGRLGVVAS